MIWEGVDKNGKVGSGRAEEQGAVEQNLYAMDCGEVIVD
jgi:hypothetical protein